MKTSKRCVVFFLFLFPLMLRAQTFETGGIVGADYEMKILKGWHWGAETEFRFDNNFTHFDRFEVGVGTDYTCWKKRIKIGVSYTYLNYHEDDFFESRHRITGALTLAEKWGGCKLSYRAAFQSTFRNEKRGDYTFNPKTYMRNRITFAYTIPQKPVKIHVSEEFWWRLYHPGHNIIDNLRTVLGVEYAINKHHTLDFYLRSDNEIQVSNPKHILYAGINYSFD